MNIDVTKDGKVFVNGKEKPQFIDRYGYMYVEIKHKKFRVHRLVAERFLENGLGLPQVNHKDGNKRNNSADNLEWCTNSENQVHSRYTLGNQTGFKDTPVRCVETGVTYKSTRDAWRHTGVSYCHISECANGKRMSAGGLTWKKVV